MSSSRLPGKMLKKINGKSLLQHVCERVAGADLPLIVCTSGESSDDPIGEECKKIGVQSFRGSLDNVGLRFIEAAEKYNLETVVRISGDSPLICPNLIKEAYSHFDDSLHLVTNTFPRTYPPGQSVEVLNMKRYKQVYQKFKDKEDFEHVTKYFYKNHKAVRIKNFSNDTDLSSLRMVVDTDGDLRKMTQLYAANPGIFSLTFKEILRTLRTDL